MSAAMPHERRARFHRGQRVKFVGTFGNGDGPIGTVRGISAAGMLVAWSDSSRTERVHPEDVQPVRIRNAQTTKTTQPERITQ